MTQPGKHVYYVAYSCPGHLGAMSVYAEQPARTEADVKALIDEVQRINGADTVVINYQLINPPAPVDTATIAGLVDTAKHDLAAGATPKTILTNLLVELHKISR